ncbi:MAG: 50S ribosome-binding GTPase [Myxococcales bacterium]|nr:50S ribosome-binding GTPase [Myxococcales bacterium]
MSAPVSTTETMNIVIVGHVDHGKSTMVGRLLADTGTLPEGKVEKVQATCRRQGKVFEYAFLLDALEAEQDQGITIDAARVFFKTAKRDYIIIDAPGHVEFLKNMVTGAARAEAAVLLIDAGEGVQENSRRHGYLLAMLGIRQVVVAVNKMDLVDYDQGAFDAIVAEYREFLAEIGVEPLQFIPVASRTGEMIARRSDKLTWYDGPTILEAVDGLSKQPQQENLPLRFPVQDVYKWGHRGDDRRIVAGRVEAGSLAVGDEVVFWPSGKRSRVASIEAFSAPSVERIGARRSTGITLTEQIFADRGDVISHADAPPAVANRLRVKLFWLGRAPMTQGRAYKLKLATAEVEARIVAIHRVLDASDLDSSTDKRLVERHDVADVTLALRRPIAVDRAEDSEATGRFVVVDNYDIAGGGIVSAHKLDAIAAASGAQRRHALLGHGPALVNIRGPAERGRAIADALEGELIGLGNLAYVVDEGASPSVIAALLDAGLIVIAPGEANLVDPPAPCVDVALGGGEGDVILDADVSAAAACDAILGELASHDRLRQH